MSDAEEFKHLTTLFPVQKSVQYRYCENKYPKNATHCPIGHQRQSIFLSMGIFIVLFYSNIDLLAGQKYHDNAVNDANFVLHSHFLYSTVT